MKWQKTRLKFLSACLAFMLLALPSLAFPPGLGAQETAEEEENPGISLEQAIAMALKHSDSIKKVESQIDQNRELRDYYATQLGYLPAAPGTAIVEGPWGQMLSTDLQWQMSKKNLTSTQQQVEFNACNLYWNILKAQKQAEVTAIAEKAALLKLQVARVSFNVGMVADIGQTSAESAYKTAQANSESAKNDLDKAYIAFNQAIGLSADQRPVLSDTVEFEPLAVSTNVDYEVARVLESSPTYWTAQQMVSLKKISKEVSLYTDVYQIYKSNTEDVVQAESDVASVKKQLEQTTRSLYYSIRSLEEKYVETAKQIQVIQENLRITQLKFDLGMATAAELAEINKTVATAEAGLFELACAHEYQKLALQRPWAASGSM